MLKLQVTPIALQLWKQTDVHLQDWWTVTYRYMSQSRIRKIMFQLFVWTQSLISMTIVYSTVINTGYILIIEALIPNIQNLYDMNQCE